MDSSKRTKTEKAWYELFEKHKILATIKKSGLFEITAQQINEVREARLMAYFDHRAGLPGLFRDNGLSILPTKRGKYIIGEFQAYQPIDYSNESKVKKLMLPENVCSVDPSNLYSEAIALNCAFLSGMVDDLLSEKAYHTLSGRMKTGGFEFRIETGKGSVSKISVDNVQCEIDGGYESENKLLIVEAKNVKSRDFLIRQLFYPYRLWHGRISKKVIPVFMTFSNDVFTFFIYEFVDPNRYNSLRFLDQRKYVIAQARISERDMKSLLRTVSVISEPNVPFPQADFFERIVDLLGLLMNDNMTADDITTNYDFDKRQTDYYTNAAIYLDLAIKSRESGQTQYTISDRGKEIMSKVRKEKLLLLVKQILTHDVFNKGLRKRFAKHKPLTIDEVCMLMKESKIYKVESEKTYRRRAQTVIKWIEWIISLSNS